MHTNSHAGPPLTSSNLYADTGALLREAVLIQPGFERSVDGITRINYLHNGGEEKDKGKGIWDEDML